MAFTDETSTLTDELIIAIAKIDPNNTSRLKHLKRRVEDSFKSASHGRTDQFAVAKQLEGLQEKFQVLNKDELADALRVRLTELEEYRNSWFPEILSLLLQLSNRPALLSELSRLPKRQPEGVVERLSWSELDASGSAYCDDDIWECIDYGADSSEEDDELISSGRSDASVPQTLPSSPIPSDEEYDIPDEVFLPDADQDFIVAIKDAQFWRAENQGVFTQARSASSQVVTELQVIKETIFMLQGLPTSLFWRLDDNIEVDRRYTLAHASNESLTSLLQSLGVIGARIDVLRQFTKTKQAVPFMQTFHRCIEGHLHKFDAFLSKIQSGFLPQRTSVSISLLQLAEDVRNESRMLVILSDLISNLQCNASGNCVRCLDLLYDSVCLNQATGDDSEFKVLAGLFLSCLETYMRPIHRWMEEGQLDSRQGTFFIIDNHNDNDLRSLWREWYTLDETSGLEHIPQFMKPFARQIFTAGKSMVFLQHLNALDEVEQHQKTALTFEGMSNDEHASLVYLPFAATFGSALDKVVKANQSFTSNLLHQELDRQCGLWTSLNALEHIYLCKDISVSGAIDGKIFDLMDRGRGAWSDRYLLTELAQSAFSRLSFVDPSRLIVRSHQDPEGLGRSVKMLRMISFDYILPWPVANIITKDAIQSYQRISIFFMQIRRAKQLVVKQRLQYTTETDAFSTDRASNALSYALRHNMLWFLNTLYSHMTDFVISTTTNSFHQSLAAAKDVDAMIATHRAYMSSLEDQCLLSRNLSPLHQATIALLDLCVYFADIQATRHGENQFDHSKTPGKYARLPRRKPHFASKDEEHSDEDEQDHDSDSQDDSDADIGNTTAISFYEAPYADRLRDVQDQYDQLVGFLAAGLKGVGRVDGQISWEILAEKLEWRKRRPAV
ncbi:putative gamma-tubulin complex component GCP5 [Aspergillus clavatus NRRL 1]|uniref:Spindle pole body component n=1 Tax=Aspergillus clavatus (strain ATCC 1007 / CBS 513.65 / DSM 816 / NCTC 3887 / NRRL 1 / QM 1276 / 107) TaxID=344612 RepID=A1C564_ASPCL|nr:gamma-tubulin complex component GCP5, putative [Aspergillus clavatus NRRL 1]EAW14832.1 gamma-tubulin complex component GCP5, putative [Aspergillus clavatus NRRL 1]